MSQGMGGVEVSEEEVEYHLGLSFSFSPAAGDPGRIFLTGLGSAIARRLVTPNVSHLPENSGRA